MRAKLPALRQALAGRFRPHHAFLTTQILAHLDHLEQTIDALSDRIATVLAPFADAVQRRDTIPGVNQRTAEVLIAEIGVDMSRFPSDRHLASWAGLCPGVLASTRRARPGKAASGCGRAWSRPLSGRHARRTAPWPHATVASSGIADTKRRSSRSRTTSLSPPITSLRTTRRPRNSAPTITTDAIQSAWPGAPCRRSSNRATESPSNASPEARSFSEEL
jgi:transposase